ncbi:hypothetical protein DPMN_014296 [Dreissena polymorpha]|uniref:Uncharacterized protein n=1 Tax=Dreissena polymorpha TaxID=45954 RepID=A0A9D4N5R6_DREPO|nr:hypothetical protein DPMN_014296 [Dreissena polymorpha]
MAAKPPTFSLIRNRYKPTEVKPSRWRQTANILTHHILNRQKPTVVNRQEGRQAYQPIRRPISLHFNQSER